MRKYETIAILRPESSDEYIATLAKKVEKAITHKPGELLKKDDWGVKRLAYEIQVPPPAAFAPGSTDDPAQRRAFSGGGYSAPAPMPAAPSADAQVEEIVRRVLLELKK